MTMVIKDLKDIKKYDGTAKPLLSISFTSNISLPLLLVHLDMSLLYGKGSCKISLQKWGNALAFILLIMAFNYVSVTLQGKKVQ